MHILTLFLTFENSGVSNHKELDLWKDGGMEDDGYWRKNYKGFDDWKLREARES